MKVVVIESIGVRCGKGNRIKRKRRRWGIRANLE